MSDERARQAVELRLAGVGYPQIATQLGYDTPSLAADAVRAALDVDSGETQADLRRQELERLDAMLTGLWKTARRGDVLAVDRVMRLTERRARVLGISGYGDSELRAAFDSSVEASAELGRVDDALVEAGRKLADRIDEATATGEGQEVTKALYLMPHLVNILRELLATPAARHAAGVEKKDAGGGKLAQLQSVQAQRRRRAG